MLSHTKIVRFLRSRSDDADYMSDETTAFKQLVLELEEGNLSGLSLVIPDMAPDHDNPDSYRLYCSIETPINETDVETAARIQAAYDEAAAAGWFEVLKGI